MESRNLQEQNFYNKKQTSAYCENYVKEPLLHLRTKNQRQKRQRKQRFNTKRKIFTYGRKCMQSLNFDEQEFLHYNQKNNNSKSYLHDHHRGSNTFRARPFHSDFVPQKIVTNSSMTLTTEATNFWYDEDRRSPYNKDDHSIYHTRTEEEKQRPRQEWLRQQERERQHEELNQEKILEYERKRAQAIKLAERKPLHHSRSRSDSKSPMHFWYDEDRRSPYNKDDHSIYHTRTEEEKQRRRQEWLRQQERERQHEKLKQQKILEYERKRAQAMKLAEREPSRHSRSRSNSKSPTHYHHRGRSTSNASKSGTLYEKSDESLSRAVSLFKNSQGIQISDTELRRIKINIRRNIAKESVSELRRDIVHPEDVIIKRRKGEGCKPIFDRNEIKKHMIDATNKKHFYKITVSSKDQFSQTSESFLKEKFEASQSST